MVRTLNFLAPSLHPNTLIDVSFAEPTFGLSGVSSPDEPVVRRLAIKYGEHQAVGGIKRMVNLGDNKVIMTDDKFQVSTLELSALDAEAPSPPTIISQESIKGRSKDIWAGLVPVEGGVVSALTSGLLTYHPSSGSSSSRTVSSPLSCLASTPLAPTQFALGGKEVDVSIWDVERTFASDATMTDAKRKKNTLEPGQVWEAKNMPNNYLKLRPPIYHQALSWLHTPDALVSGTKMGTVRRFDTRQRKPVADWKVAREGGVGCLVPVSEHELLFSDKSNYLACLDLRTGRVLYSYASLTATPHHLLDIPPVSSSPLPPNTKRIGFASISSDASIRIHSCTSLPEADAKGNWGGDGKKGDIAGMVGAVGTGGFVWRGYGEREVIVEKKKKKEGEEGEDDSEDEEEMWEGMDEVEDEGEESEEDEEDEEDDSESEEEVPKKSKRTKRS